MRDVLCIGLAAALAAVVPQLALAVAVPPGRAAAVASGFSARGRTLGARLGSVAEKVSCLEFDAGGSVYAVKMYGGGTVFTADNTTDSPVIAFTSATNDFSEVDRRSPLWALLAQNARCRASHALAATPVDCSAEWSSLEALGGGILGATILGAGRLTSIGDMRVEALVKSKWDQDNAKGLYCYNLYTPSHYVCGCVATAASQVMRYHSWPTNDVAARTNTNCYHGANANSATNITLTMQGGIYDWENMTLDPKSAATLTLTNRQAIGKLTSDVGIACNMMYTSASGSGTYSAVAHDAFLDYFGYSKAVFLDLYEQSFGDTSLKNAIFANLDAKLPVMLGIDGSSVGHSIVADGYGYSDGVAYVHLNMGWGGSNDFWYNLPEVTAGGYVFTSVSDIIYNIMPRSSGAVLSGRVWDGENAISNATVTVLQKKSSFWSTTTTEVATARTTENGVYAFVLPASSSRSPYVIRAVSPDGRLTNSLSSITLSAPSETRMTFSFYRPNNSLAYEYTTKCVTKESGVGNRWGNDIVLAAKVVSLSVAGPSAAGCLPPLLEPAAGGRSYIEGDTVTLRAEAWLYATNEFGEVCARMPCMGFEGSGSVPSSGVTNEIVVTLTKDSSIAWKYAASPSDYRVREWETYPGWKMYDSLYGSCYETWQMSEWWIAAGATIDLEIPADATDGDAFVWTNSYIRTGSSEMEYGELKMKFCLVALSFPGDAYEEYVLDETRHYAMPTNLSLVADRAYDINYWYLPTIDVTEGGLQTWWYYRWLFGAKWYGLVGDEDCNADADPDNDGRSNKKEFRTGTDPLDPSSRSPDPTILLLN